MGLTADQLVAATNRRCGWASTNGPLADSASSETHEAAILALADEELSGDAWPLVMASHGDYYLTTKDYAVAAGQRFYRLPNRSYGSVADVLWGDTGATDDQFRSLGVIERESIGLSYSIGGVDPASSRHFLDGDRVGLWPAPAEARGTLRVKYFLHPSRLVVTTSTRVAPITSFSYSGTTATVGWTSGQLTPDGRVCDIVSAGNAHAALVVDTTMTAATGDTNTFTAACDPLVAVGDYLCDYGYTPVVQLPDFMLPYFVRRVAAAALMAQGDRAAAAAELQAAAQLYEKAQSTSKPRNQAEPRTLVTRNSPLRLRGGYSWGR